MPRDLSLFGGAEAPLSLTALLLNLAIGIVLSGVLSWHFKRFGSVLSNRSEFAQIFPFVLLTTILIISVVKSSLALSLGLVGALSIVRFRTPIKEPEELAYLFAAIAMGLGLGANQRLATIVAGGTILFVMAILKWRRGVGGSSNVFFSIQWDNEAGGEVEERVRRLNDLISEHVDSSDLRRFDVRGDSFEATYLLDVRGMSSLAAMTDEMQREFPGAGMTFLDQNRIPGM